MDTVYKLIRSKRRTISIEVTASCEIIVRAPLFAGMKEIEAFVQKEDEWIKKAVMRQKSRPPEPGDSQKEQLTALAKATLPGKVRYYSEKMGMDMPNIRITGARTRFGSCSPKNTLCFSWRLMAYPDDAVDYVVVHELAHIRHKNHGKDFYREIEKVLPDYKKRIKLLK